MVYGREPPRLLTYVPSTAKVAAVEDELLQRDLVLADLKENIKVSQERMKRSYDSKHREKILKLAIGFICDFGLIGKFLLLCEGMQSYLHGFMVLFVSCNVLDKLLTNWNCCRTQGFI